MKLLVKGIIFFIALSLVTYAYAAETSNVSPGNKGTGMIRGVANQHKAVGLKAERGIKNILFGWTDIPKTIVQVTKESRNPIWGITAGTLKGIGKALPRTVSGIADVATFPIADYEKPAVKPDEINTQIK